ncbi:MAG: hypothetical protein JWP40_1567 [Blastococcus sp.]|nr:hypothetical protein [Blastococcus sp.]
MSAMRRKTPLARRLLRVLAIWIGFQVMVGVLSRLVAHRLDRGDENATDIRRVLVMSGTELRPTNPALSRVRLDLAMGGGLLDLTAVPPTPGGVDVTVRALMGGLGLRVPAGWRVWWDFRGAMGGMGADTGIQRVTDPAAADVRVDARAVMGGVGIETPKD